jgi:hypothetical protein
MSPWSDFPDGPSSGQRPSFLQSPGSDGSIKLSCVVNFACKAIDPLLRLISTAHLNAILERAGVLGDLHVQDVTIISDRPTLVRGLSGRG